MAKNSPPPLLLQSDEITATANAVNMFREKAGQALPEDYDEVSDILLDAVAAAIDWGAGQWYYDTSAGNTRTLAVSLEEPYEDVVALLRLDEHKAPSEGYTRSFAIITVMPRARAHKAQQEGRWVQSPDVAFDFVSRPDDPDRILLTFVIGGRWRSELVSEDQVAARVSGLISEGADPMSFVRWKRVPPEERSVDVVIRF